MTMKSEKKYMELLINLENLLFPFSRLHKPFSILIHCNLVPKKNAALINEKGTYTINKPINTDLGIYFIFPNGEHTNFRLEKFNQIFFIFKSPVDFLYLKL